MKIDDLSKDEDICQYLLKVPENIKPLITYPINTAYLIRCAHDGKGIYISPDPPLKPRRLEILVMMVPTDIFQWEIVGPTKDRI